MVSRPWLDHYAAGVEWDAHYEAKPLYRLIDEAAISYANHNAIDFLDRKFTYRQLQDQINRAAKGFQKIGVEKGIKVGLFLPNCPQFVVCYYAILKAGGTVVNFSPLYSEPELLEQVEDSDTDIMVTLNLKALYPIMRRVFEKSRLKLLVTGTMDEVLPFPKSLLFRLFKRSTRAPVVDDETNIWFKDLIANDGNFSPVDINPAEDVAVLQYTGGTTGVPKGAMLTHANLYINACQSSDIDTVSLRGYERAMGVLPLFHVFAMTGVMNQSIRTGAEMLMLPRFELDAVMKLIAGKKATLMSGVPTMYTAILGHPDATPETLGSIKACVSGGAPLPVDLKARFEQISGCKLVEGYGLTETSPIAAANPFHGVNKPGSIGLPAPATDIIIVDSDDPTIFLKQGEVGEICISGPQVMKGYWKRPEATAQAIVPVDGGIGRMLRTGDIGYIDEEGYTFIIDRKKDMILVSGFNVFPRKLEEIILQHPAVREVTVIGVPDDYQGEAPKAFVVLEPGHENVTEDKIMEFLKAKLGKHEMPREIEFRSELPKTMIGKLSKKELVAEEKAKYDLSKAGKSGHAAS
jgi:long-chain acyl-CoA synthetase